MTSLKSVLEKGLFSCFVLLLTTWKVKSTASHNILMDKLMKHSLDK